MSAETVAVVVVTFNRADLVERLVRAAATGMAAFHHSARPAEAAFQHC